MQQVQTLETNDTQTHNFIITDAAAAKIVDMAKDDGSFAFRIAVNGGGCSGFQYDFSLAEKANDDDIIFKNGNAKVVIDETSIEFLEGGKIDWVDDLIGSSFRVKNPNARSSCGCGVSFSI